MARSDPRHIDSGSAPSQAAVGKLPGANASVGDLKAGSFEDVLLSALEGVNSDQLEASELSELLVTNPEEVDAHELTIAMSKASLSLNIARTVMDRVVRAWKEVLNTR
jgi:flagellar hook-basal body complex protein FliE